MPRLRNPASGTVDDFTEGQARVRRRRGWVDVDDENLVPDMTPRHTRAPTIAASTVDQVLDWVDDDPDRAAAALQAEQQRPDGPRVTLTDRLKAITQ